LELNALADAGFQVLTCNPRGSTGYGEAYARAIHGRWGDKDARTLYITASTSIFRIKLKIPGVRN